MTENLPALNALSKRRIYDAIRAAYDIGYSDARNASARSGDGAPGYMGRDIEKDHGDALLSALNAQLAASVAEAAQSLPDGWKPVPVEPTEAMMKAAHKLPDILDIGDEYRAMLAASPAQPVQPPKRCPNCDDTGDVHSIDGEWRGVCHCPAGQAIKAAQPKD